MSTTAARPGMEATIWDKLGDRFNGFIEGSVGMICVRVDSAAGCSGEIGRPGVFDQVAKLQLPTHKEILGLHFGSSSLTNSHVIGRAGGSGAPT